MLMLRWTMLLSGILHFMRSCGKTVSIMDSLQFDQSGYAFGGIRPYFTQPRCSSRRSTLQQCKFALYKLSLNVYPPDLSRRPSGRIFFAHFVTIAVTISPRFDVLVCIHMFFRDILVFVCINISGTSNREAEEMSPCIGNFCMTFPSILQLLYRMTS